MKSSSDLAALNPFEKHLILLDALLANWRPYIVYLRKQITEQARVYVVFSEFTTLTIHLVRQSAGRVD